MHVFKLVPDAHEIEPLDESDLLLGVCSRI